MTIGHGACEEDMGEIFQEFLGRVEDGVTKGYVQTCIGIRIWGKRDELEFWVSHGS